MTKNEEAPELTWSLLAKRLRWLANHPDELRRMADEAERKGKEEKALNSGEKPRP